VGEEVALGELRIDGEVGAVERHASGDAGKPVDIWVDKPVKGPDGMRAANGKLFLTENGAGKIDMVTVGGDAASITVLQEGRVLVEGTPNEIKGNAKVQEAYLGGVRAA